ncbi:MAG: TIGR01777 family oxidoreductase [Gemmatimonadales bacterium]
MVAELRSELPVSAAEAFAWHARPGAFERLVPPWEHVALVAPHPGLAEGARMEFDVRVGLVPVRWVARHEQVTAPAGFVDVQERGPFARWRHTHRFEDLGPGRCALIDRIDADLPGGPLGELGDPFLRRRLRRTLRYRHAVTAGDLALHAAAADRPRLRVALSGASGLIGTTLRAMLTTGGHTVIPMVRRSAGPGEIAWDPRSGRLDPADLADIDAVVHLAAESIADGRWTEARRARIRESRVAGTGTIARALTAAPRRPRVLVSASAIGIYGDRGDEVLTEESVPSDAGFLPDVARGWEQATEPAEAAGVRVVRARFGVILSPAGGALAKMRLPFALGGGAPLGAGTQWMSWISIDDAAGAVMHLLQDTAAGPVNVVAPAPVTNRDFTTALGRALHRPTVLPAIPAPLLRFALGDLADEALLASTRVRPARLEATGYRFRHPALADALRHVLGSDRP